MPRSPVWLLMIACVLVAAGCTPTTTDPAPTPTASPTRNAAPRTELPPDATTVVAGTTAAGLALATSRALFRHSPAVVVVAEGDADGLDRAGEIAIRLGVPLLLAPVVANVPPSAGSAGPSTAAPTASAVAVASSAPGAGTGSDGELLQELARLAPQTIATVGDGAAAWARTAPLPAAEATKVVAADSGSPAVVPAPPLTDLLVLGLDDATSAAALATARASGARVLLLPGPDPRTSDETIKALAGQSTARVLALGNAFGPADQLRRRIDVAATGVTLPGGGQVVFPGRRMIALYGHPGDSVLGSLGEQSLDRAIVRAKKVAADYSSLVDGPVVPAFEIITTVASASAGSDGNYSNEVPVAKLRPWVEAAGKAGLYVMLDLQPGRTDFLTQARQYEELLRLPHVGLALDPEWRLKPGQVHMVQIGSVGAAEINQTAQWLAELTRANKLPQKVLMVHQFRLDMITDRSTMRTDYDELRVVIHVDGFGTAGQKMDTWRAINRNAPAGVFWGWKNFYDEDKPTFTPRQTMGVSPLPVFVSYQ